MVGIIGLPIPLNVPHITSLIPQIKYVLEISIIFCCEYAITAGDDDIIPDNCPENIAEEISNEVRINNACFLIDTYKHLLSLSEIAEKCGYTDYIYFSRRFKQITKVSPRKYLEEN